MNNTDTTSTNLEELSNQIATIQNQLTELIQDKEKQIAIKPLGKIS
jgi:DNA-binding Xre family transcriptional regulator